ncbi:B3 domain-containing protein REM10-like [Malania oleifera]|uniref:B3 domain-containing protein REM10-like n=1 Tax=Malania oleifera TaxID=397392 RepID=UPI0025AD9D67|nr:B3 domain-containing protein REM10-like [Malania oleifera]XP_057958165.1 B3 domain-containing protein REM10-like [Malania oleifera]XP_057958167.1 B3 domain-containing protein REM10-like [Malania oleifera]
MAACRRSALPASKPHFFQPLLPDFHLQLLIPSAFFLKYLGGGGDGDGDGHSCNQQQAVLRSCLVAGKQWLVKVNGRRLQEGWPEFAREHDLHVGDFLLFRHEGDMVFHVMVFDPSACQKKYYRHFIKSEEDDDQSSNAHLPAHHFHHESEGLLKNKRAKIHPKPTAAAATSLSLKYPYFARTIKPYNINKSSMGIPTEFARANGLISKREMIFEDEKGRSWPVKVNRNKGRFSVGQGWRKALTANGIKGGDFLAFELINKGPKPTFKIHEGMNQEMSHTTPATKAMVKQETATAPAAMPLGCSPHYFVTRIRPFNLKKYLLNIPNVFARANGLCDKKCEILLRDENGRSWPMKLGHMKSRSGTRAYIGHGWIKFAVANGLKAGDSIMLELVKGGTQHVMNFYGRKFACIDCKEERMEESGLHKLEVK